MERIEPDVKPVIPVWSVEEYAKRNGLSEQEQRRLRQLLGAFATASELRHNTSRPPRWR